MPEKFLGTDLQNKKETSQFYAKGAWNKGFAAIIAFRKEEKL